jgi:predicted PurR-regulated permease PerM
MSAASDPEPDSGHSHPHSPRELWRAAVPIYVALLLAILTVAGILLLIRLQHVLLLLFISVLFAAALSGPTARMERLGVPRAIAAISLYLLTLAVFVTIGWFVLPPLFTQIAGLAEEGPAYAERYENLRLRYEELREDYPVLEPFDDQVAGIRARIVGTVGERLIDLPFRAFGLFLDALAVFFVSLMLLTNRERLLGLLMSVVHPRHRVHTEDVLRKMWRRIGFYLRAKAMVMAAIAAITYVALLVIGVPFALLLSILVGLGQLVPRVGPWVMRIPLLGVAALEGWSTLGLVFLASVVIENLKGYVISPFIEGDQLDIHPLLVFVAVLVGAALLGPAGAFVAVPFAAMLQVLFEEVILPWRRSQIAHAEPAVEAGDSVTD